MNDILSTAVKSHTKRQADAKAGGLGESLLIENIILGHLHVHSYLQSNCALVQHKPASYLTVPLLPHSPS
jgi:hypothetical protein